MANYCVQCVAWDAWMRMPRYNVTRDAEVLGEMVDYNEARRLVAARLTDDDTYAEEDGEDGPAQRYPAYVFRRSEAKDRAFDAGQHHMPCLGRGMRLANGSVAAYDELDRRISPVCATAAELLAYSTAHGFVLANAVEVAQWRDDEQGRGGLLV